MKLRTSLAAAGAAVVLGTTGALVLPAVASANSATHTLKFTAVQKATVSFTKTTGANQETDVNAAGKTVGFDMIYFAATSATSRCREHHGRHQRRIPVRHGHRQLQDRRDHQRQGDRREPARSPEPPERSRPRPSPAPSTPSRSPTAASQARQPHGGGTVPAARPSRLVRSRSTSKPAHYRPSH